MTPDKRAETPREVQHGPGKCVSVDDANRVLAQERHGIAAALADAERRGEQRVGELLTEALGALDTVTVWSGAMASAHGGIGVRDYAEQTATSIRAAIAAATTEAES